MIKTLEDKYADRTYDLTTADASKRDIELLLEQKTGERMKAFVIVQANRQEDMLRDSVNALFVSLLAVFLAVCLVTNLFEVAYSTMIILGGVLIYMFHQVYLRWVVAKERDSQGEINVMMFDRNSKLSTEQERSKLASSVSNSIGNLVEKSK